MATTRKFLTTSIDPENRLGLTQLEVGEILALSKGEVSLAERHGLEKVRLGLAEHLQQKCPHLQGQPVDFVLDEFIGGLIG